MADIKFKLNLKGLNELMKSDGMQSALNEAGEVVARSAGAGYETSDKTGRYIGFCNVFPSDGKAVRDNYKNNTLIKALSSSGLAMEK